MRKSILTSRASTCALLAITALSATTDFASAAATTGVTAPYFSIANSPLNTSSAGYQVNTFEPTSPTLASQGITLTTVNPSSVVQGFSVDADDGVIDGSGATGHSLAEPTTANATGATFTFNNLIIGAYPKSAAVAVTAYNGANLIFTVYDTSMNVSATDTLTNVSTSTPTSDDFLFWGSDPAGIGAISVSSNQAFTFLFLDHIQYDTLNTISVPEPSSLAVLLLASAGLVGRSNRKRAEI